MTVQDVRITQIVAMAANRVIGREGDMPWRIPADFRFFKETTMGHALVMGRKTFESIGRPLPGRHTLVITRNREWKAAGVQTVADLGEALEICAAHRQDWGDEAFIAGGGEIYRQAMPFTDRILLTEVHREVSGDVTYPEIPPAFTEVAREEHPEGEWPYAWVTLERLI